MFCCGANSDVTRRRWLELVLAVSGLLLLSGRGLTTDISINSFEITGPSGENAIVYNKVQDMTITFDVTVTSAGGGGGGRDVTGINVFFEDDSSVMVGDETAVESFETRTIGDGSTEKIEGNVVTLKFATKTDCQNAHSLCVEIEGDVSATNKACSEIGTSTDPTDAKNCAVITVAADSFKVTDPPVSQILYTRTDETEIVFTLTASLSDVAIPGQVDAVKVYFSQSDDDKKKSDPESGTWDGGEPIPVTAETTPLGDITASLTMDADCVHYDQLCVEISDGIIVWDEDCISLGTEEGQAGERDCSVVSIETGSLVITEPKPSEITYTTHEDTTITFDLKATTANADAEVTGVNVYFTNNKNDDTRVASVPVVAEGDAPTSENPEKIGHDDVDPTDIKGCVATLKLDEESCADYTHLCASLSAVGGVEGEECIAFGSEDAEAGEKDCESAGVRVAIVQYHVLAGLFAVFTTRLW